MFACNVLSCKWRSVKIITSEFEFPARVLPICRIERRLAAGGQWEIEGMSEAVRPFFSFFFQFRTKKKTNKQTNKTTLS